MPTQLEVYNQQSLGDFLFKTCSKTLLSQLARDSEGDYWENSEEFVLENEERSMGALTQGQRKWAHKIKDGLLEEARK